MKEIGFFFFSFCQIQQILQSLCASNDLLKCKISDCESHCKPSGSRSLLFVTNTQELTHAYSDHCNISKTKITLSYFQVYKTRHFQTVGPFCPEVTLVCSSLTSPGGSFSMRQGPTCSFPAMLCTWIFPLLSVVLQKSHLYKAERSLRACIGGSFLAFLN